MKLERLAVGGLLAALLALGGCATTGEARNPRDPWEPFNRHAYNFNEGLDRVLLKPAATWYRDKVPPLMRTGVANFFGNVGDAWSAVNNLLQWRLPEFEESLARFQLNTMFGVFGIFDVASEFNIERHKEDFGQTLGRWGVPAGPFVMLPFLGPSTLRDTMALPVERRYDLIGLIENTGVRDFTYVLNAVDRRSNLLRVGNVLEEAALDKYSFTRDAYLQRRRAQIFDREDNREAPPPGLPDESLEEPAEAAPARPPASAPAR
ncbi:MAG TPA: VacJ family lipoprotein [Ramlibacter sp.]|uniref:MlaA family lipoprotein n=1 Tax=Ramlibacter sp. TaxID=1917967 RepID=UPI002D7F7241|nr:VacJ family lipoprotein [Ramlibacter sp.]HET8745659.1 VacJ family lipoprotein [Ramlibacter sp.]